MVEFRDRYDAGEQLAALLARRHFERPVVLGIPRGGVPVAARVARALNCQLGVVVARKLRSPFQPELAVGAVTADGVTWINDEVAAGAGADPAYLTREIAHQQAEAAMREQRLDGRRRPALRGRTVIIVDDGVATGATALAAARSVKAAGAGWTVVAVPVGPAATLAALRGEADEVICLHEEDDFWAVGQLYADFRPVEDDDVAAIMDAANPVETRHVRIGRDGVELAARLRLPAGRPPVVIFVHGLGSSKDSPRNVVIAERLVDRGLGALLFDLSGHGESSGVQGEGLDAYVDDLVAVEAWARAQPGVDGKRIAVAGSSLGAVVALRATTGGRLRPSALVLRAPPAEPAEFTGLDVPTLLIVGSRDSLAEAAQRAADVSKAVELRVVDGASHLFEEPGTLQEASDITVDWLCARFESDSP